MSAAPELRIHRSMTKALRVFESDRLRWLDEAAAAGPLAGLRMGPVPLWVVTDPDLARTMLVSDAESWTRPPATLVPIRIGGGENLFSQSDKDWAQLQPAVAPAFRKKALDERLAGIDALVADEVRSIPHGATTDLELHMSRIAMSVAAFAILGERLERARAEELAHHQREVVRWVGAQLGKVTGFIPVAVGARAREMKTHRAALHAYGDEVIARVLGDARADEGVVGALRRARPRGKALSAVELRSHVLGLFLAGNETTAAALSWALVHAAREPARWSEVADDPERRTAPFVAETLRLTPAVWGVPRAPTKAGVHLATGAHRVRVRRGQPATIYLRAMHRNPAIWPDPLCFDPSRHESEGKAQVRALLPFGLGPRGCIGQHLALAELHAVLPALARHGDVVVDEPVVEDPNFALRVRGGLAGRFIARTTKDSGGAGARAS